MKALRESNKSPSLYSTHIILSKPHHNPGAIIPPYRSVNWLFGICCFPRITRNNFLIVTASDRCKGGRAPPLCDLSNIALEPCDKLGRALIYPQAQGLTSFPNSSTAAKEAGLLSGVPPKDK